MIVNWVYQDVMLVSRLIPTWYNAPIASLKRLRDEHHMRLCPSMQILLNALQAQVSGDVEACRLARKDVLLVLQLVALLYSNSQAQDLIPLIWSHWPMAYFLPRADYSIIHAGRMGHLVNSRPNCVVVYEIVEQKGLVMELRAVRPIAKGEEITISYVDPAIWLGARRSLLKMNYDFLCDCPKCQAEEQQKVYTTSAWLTNEERVAASVELIHHFLPFAPDEQLKAFSSKLAIPPLPKGLGIEEMPRSVLPMFNSTYLPETAQKFSDNAHDGSLSNAVYNGKVLLGIYFVHYTTYWPMIGLHCFELSKSIWNSYTITPPTTLAGRKGQLGEAICCAEWASQILQVSVARKGDGGSNRPPTEEIAEFRDHILAEWVALSPG
ncbi:hypothetical protein DACRYDRAFT_17900 [Dacryopinax primogenitus]|uniref:SET domain-containing protein n=1 Tax=Dacryopinax primogenitus (strain DJM 731) TaxID=1858805 RepID=M5FTK9_DACPD|nr:uncharacterized protein DACRYDRAFT_17900 [Dacryopinax primogenitus]EJT98729.1 hypothetical protein DACRYDRAFT_17900 [Dacryopinax primogenitus]